MVAPRKTTKVYCAVVRVPAQGERIPQRMNRPSDLLPWADPYIARLVQNLQQEVRYERSSTPGGWQSTTPLQADLEPPSPLPDYDRDWKEEPRWTFSDEKPG